ncbi:thiamine diphosphokinase [Clostridium cavendishii DSM 21758]|uniref:Thiamine diphosphokinase n=1 Tax=Clostridium cavendishii DSM 21758 TaxID=1121302 RepID=A0A1M6K8X0_9CLOT|nr:thiamine diphosphokinase [Clostridium cavendishii]SHJ55421.1 thiamine diphosphokinase [Clostridium cavendishii DSM 21758]
MKCLIVTGGTEPKEMLFKEEVAKAELLIAADKGVETYFKYNVRPDFLLGDLDSAISVSKEFLDSIKIIKFNPEKDFTDTELAVEKAIELGATEIVLLGATGTRLDHVIGNLGILNRCLSKNVRAIIKDDNNKIFVVNKGCNLFGEKGQFISFQALGEEVKGFSIKGAKYPLDSYNLSFGDPRTISNEFLDSSIHIDFKTGKILVIYSRD